MQSIAAYIFTAIAEIAGCIAFWAWLRSGKSVLWVVSGIASLILFAWLLTRVEAEFAGRAYAAYGGVYITASILWMWAVERSTPDHWDITGLVVCLIGAGIILFAPR